MLKPTELREQSNLHLQQAEKEKDPKLRSSLVSLAFSLVQLAEQIEREQASIQVIADAIAWNREQRQMGFAPLDAETAAFKIMERLKSAGYKIVSASPAAAAQNQSTASSQLFSIAAVRRSENTSPTGTAG